MNNNKNSKINKLLYKLWANAFLIQIRSSTNFHCLPVLISEVRSNIHLPSPTIFKAFKGGYSLEKSKSITLAIDSFRLQTS